MSQTVFAYKDQYERELLEWHVRPFRDGKLLALCHEIVLPLEVTFAYSDEPVPLRKFLNCASSLSK